MSDANRLAFTAARLAIVQAAAAASTICGITSVQQQQLRAIAGLAALDLHRVVGMAGDLDDAERMASDLLAIARPVDRLVEAIGAEGARVFAATIDQSLFRQQLEKALDGDATFELTEAGREADQDRYDNDEPPGSARARDAMS